MVRDRARRDATSDLLTTSDLHAAFMSRLGACRLDDLSNVVRRRSDQSSDPIGDGNTEWTNVLLNLRGVERGFTVYPRRLYRAWGRLYGFNAKYDRPRRQDDRGEHLVDACWTTYPTSDGEWIAALERGPVAPPRIVLACECEWASTVRGPLSSASRLVAVLNDFSKLTDITAERKVMMFAFDRELPFEAIADCCARQTEPRRPDEEYLLLGWPRTASWSDRACTAKARIL